MVPFVVLASGRGSNFEAIQKAFSSKKMGGELLAVLSDRADAPVLAKAREMGVKALVVEPPKTDDFRRKPMAEQRQIHDDMVIKALIPFRPRFLVMAGYM